MIIYPLAIIKHRKARNIGTIVSVLVIAVAIIVSIIIPYRYNTTILTNSEKHPFDDTYKVYLKDKNMATYISNMMKNWMIGYFKHPLKGLEK